MEPKKQYAALRLIAAERGGYMVMVASEMRGEYAAMLFAGTLGQCLHFINGAIRPDPRKQPNPPQPL